MPGSQTVQVPRGPPYPGAPVELSRLAFSVTVGPSAGEARVAVALLRRALDAGITTFDTIDVPDPVLAESVLGQAFPHGDPRLVVLTASRTGPPGPVPGPPGRVYPRLEGAGGTGSANSSPNAPDRFVRLFEFEPAMPTGSKLGRGSGPGADLTGGTPLPGILRGRSVEEIQRVVGAESWPLVAGPFSLVERSLAPMVAEALGSGRLRWIARDVLAGGRLDGSRFAPESVPLAGGVPRSLLQLGAEFATIAPFGFLALAGRRTLAQAAIRYVSDLPWVACCCVPLPSPARWAEIVGSFDAPSLTEAERRRAEAVPQRGGSS